MTNAEIALEHLNSGDINWDMWLFEHSDIIRRALKIAAAVDGDDEVMPETWTDAAGFKNRNGEGVGNNDLLERLRGIV